TIARYLADETTPEENAELLRILEESEDVRRDFFALKDVWHALHPAFGGEQIETERAEKLLLARTGIVRERWHHRWLKMFMRIAAVLLIPVAVLAVYLGLRGGGQLHVPEYTIAAAYGYTVETELPDGSHVWLNANSSLSYPARFSSRERGVSLRGEGYFSVQADKEHPFCVHTPDMAVTATGTQFNVNAYERTGRSMVTLVDGRVSVDACGRTYRIAPGEHLELCNDTVNLSTDVNVEKYCSWRDGILIFDNDPLRDICERLEQLHNVDFEIDPEVADDHFHIILKGENLDDMLHMLQMSAPVVCTPAETEEGPLARQHITICRSEADRQS
ncbi:MAG: FecR domain-containing protein, partial [Muribaculaceae bacterium]|nr:FecR domain-containing protein [Muribaculaceae bacterium]